MAVITLSEYKLLAGISGSTQDALITALIPMVQSDIVEMCNYDFGQGTDDEDFPAGMKIYAAQMITYQMSTAGNVPTMESESIDGYSYTRSAISQGGYPKSIEDGLTSKWKRVSAKIPQERTAFRDRRGQTPQQISEEKPSYFTPDAPIG